MLPRMFLLDGDVARLRRWHYPVATVRQQHGLVVQQRFRNGSNSMVLRLPTGGCRDSSASISLFSSSLNSGKAGTQSSVGIVVGQPNLNIKIDREKTMRYGLNTGDVNTVLQAAPGGTNATTLLEGDR